MIWILASCLLLAVAAAGESGRGILVNVPDGSNAGGVTVLVKQLEIFRAHPRNGTDPRFHVNLFGKMLGRTRKTSSAGRNRTREPETRPRNKFAFFKIFRGLFALASNGSDSTERPQPDRKTPPPLGKNDLELKLGDELTETGAKVSHLSHIYLGTSLYPLLTQESRILGGGESTTPETTTRQLGVLQSDRIYPLTSLTKP